MCGIVGSKDPNKIKGVIKDLIIRGPRAWSVAAVSLHDNLFSTIQSKAENGVENLEACVLEAVEEIEKNDSNGLYYILHLQAPTTLTYEHHPAQIVNSNNILHALWHNGMMDSNELEKFKSKNGNKPWDTHLLLEMIMHTPNGSKSGYSKSEARRLRAQLGVLETPEITNTNLLLAPPLLQLQSLNLFQGSFACLYFIQGMGLYAFRNRIAPMYIDDEFTVCSVPFEGAKKMNPNTVYSLETNGPIGIFNNTYDPFGV